MGRRRAGSGPGEPSAHLRSRGAHDGGRPGVDAHLSNFGGFATPVRRVIKNQLPTIFHTEALPPGVNLKHIRDTLATYRATLPASSQALLYRHELRDAAIKVVGVGSAGTVCLIFLLMAAEGDPLFLQIKEARASVLERYAGSSPFPNHGQREEQVAAVGLDLQSPPRHRLSLGVAPDPREGETGVVPGARVGG